jgi:iron complex transport system substrate-binding protein
VQAHLAEELIKRGFPVLATNQRTLTEIEATLSLLSRVVDCEVRGKDLLSEFRHRLAPVKTVAARPRVYFEEWNDPLISGIGWVGELIERAGGDDVFARLRTCRAAAERVVSSEQVCSAAPEIILASWCGKPVRSDAICSRPGWAGLPAVRSDRIYEIPGEDILQPGFRLVHGYERLKAIIHGK